MKIKNDPEWQTVQVIGPNILLSVIGKALGNKEYKVKIVPVYVWDKDEKFQKLVSDLLDVFGNPENIKIEQIEEEISDEEKELRKWVL